MLSVLFYEPKFPKCETNGGRVCLSATFSALLRAEIPKIKVQTPVQALEVALSVLFYEPKFPKYTVLDSQRRRLSGFQCSSTSRNSQNAPVAAPALTARSTFSALLRAEIPKISERLKQAGLGAILSVLFYEPKFPKFIFHVVIENAAGIFQCSSTSRNSQNCGYRKRGRDRRCHFQCSSTSRNSQNRVRLMVSVKYRPFSALLRAEIPKIFYRDGQWGASELFQCSSTSRNSQNQLEVRDGISTCTLSVLFYEPKFPKL